MSVTRPGGLSPVPNLWRQRELLWQFTLRNIEMRHRGSHLGLVWSFLNPLLMLGLYVMVLGFMLGGKFGVIPGESRMEYGLGIFLSLSLFQFVAEILGISPLLIVSNPNFVKKVVFPLEIIPAASTAGALFHLGVSLVLVLIGLVCFGPGLHAGLLWLPVIILPIMLLGLGVSWLLAALGVFFRDIGQITQFISTALMWASGVFFTAQRFPTAWPWLRLNPLLLAIDEARNAALWQLPLNLTHLGYVYACGLASCLAGHWVFQKLKPAFADVL